MLFPDRLQRPGLLAHQPLDPLRLPKGRPGGTELGIRRSHVCHRFPRLLLRLGKGGWEAGTTIK